MYVHNVWKPGKKKPLGVSIFFLLYGSRNSAQVVSLAASAFSCWAILLAFFFFLSLDRILHIPGWLQPPSVAEDDLEPAWFTRLPLATGRIQKWNYDWLWVFRPASVLKLQAGTAHGDCQCECWCEPESSRSLIGLAAFSFLGGSTVFSW